MASWLDPLLAHPPHGFTFLSESEAEEVAEAPFDTSLYGPPPLIQPLLDQRLNYRLLAEGPPAIDRSGDRVIPQLWTERPDPRQLWLALVPGTPPSLWIPAGTTAESLAAAIAPYAHSFEGWDEPVRPLGEEYLEVFRTGALTGPLSPTTRTWRAYYGLVHELTELENAILFSQWADAMPIRVVEGQPPPEPGAPYVSMFDTRFSASRIVLFAQPDVMPGDLLLLTLLVLYGAHDDAEVIARYNQQFGTDLPPDLPVDVAGTLTLAFAPVGAERLEQQIEQGTGDPYLLLLARALVDEGHPHTMLERYRDHANPRVVEAVTRVRAMFGPAR